MFDRQDLSDHPAQRDADQVRRAHSEIVDQACSVGRHVGERVRYRPGRGRLIGARTVGKMARQPDISVVEPDDEQASIDKFLGRSRRPRRSTGHPDLR